MKNTHQVGDRTEAAVLSRAVALGYAVSIPFGSHRYDFIFDDGKALQRIQCKTGRLKGGCLVFSTCSVNAKRHRTYQGEADCFAVYCRESGRVYLVPANLTNKREAWLRVDPPHPSKKDDHKIRWAKDHEF